MKGDSPRYSVNTGSRDLLSSGRSRAAKLAPTGTSSFGLVKFQQLIEHVLGRRVDLVEYGGLKPGLDDDIRREAVLL